MRAVEHQYVQLLSDPRCALRLFVPTFDPERPIPVAGKVFQHLCFSSNGYKWRAEWLLDGKGHLNIRIVRGKRVVKEQPQSQRLSIEAVPDRKRALGLLIKTFDPERVIHTTGKVFKRLTFSSCGYVWRAEGLCDDNGHLNIRIIRKEMVPREITWDPIRKITSDPIRKITNAPIRPITSRRIE